MNGARQHTSGCHTYVYELYPINQRNRASCNRGGHSIMIVRVYSLMAANLKLISRLIITVPRWTLRSRCHTLLRRGVLYFFLPLSLSLSSMSFSLSPRFSSSSNPLLCDDQEKGSSSSRPRRRGILPRVSLLASIDLSHPNLSVSLSLSPSFHALDRAYATYWRIYTQRRNKRWTTLILRFGGRWCIVRSSLSLASSLGPRIYSAA